MRPFWLMLGVEVNGKEQEANTQASRRVAVFGIVAGAGLRKKTQRDLVQRSFFIAKDDWTRLKDYFEDQGLATSTGVRQVLRNFMKDKVLI